MAYEVTIGIPTYNVEKYIRLTMDSALAQTFQSIEFLVLDDCGTDGSMAIVREYQQQHPRGKDIRIVRQPQNGGLGRARNRIIAEARGKYLYHLDADDAIAPNTIELLYQAAQQYQADIVYGSYERVEDFDGHVKKTKMVYPALQFLKEDEYASWVYRKYEGIQGMTWNFLIDIDIYRKNGLQHQPVNYWEDFSFTLDLPTYVTRAVLLPDVTYSYYCRSGSLSNYEERTHIDKEEIWRTVRAVNQNKDHSDRIRQKVYFPQRMYKLMMTDFYMVCNILKSHDVITPAFSNQELRDIMKSPLTVMEIIKFKHMRFRNMVLYLLSVLPPGLSVAIIRMIGKWKGIIN